jgi:hypothetical protein
MASMRMRNSDTPPPITVEDTATGAGPLPSPDMDGMNGEWPREEKKRSTTDFRKEEQTGVDHEQCLELLVVA